MAEGTLTLNNQELKLVFNFRVLHKFKRATSIGDVQRLQEILTDAEYLPLLLHLMNAEARGKDGNAPPAAWFEEQIDLQNFESVIDAVTEVTVGNSRQTPEGSPAGEEGAGSP